MQWIHNIKRARQIIGIFIAFFILLGVMGALGVYGVNSVLFDFKEIYQNRLVPATDVTTTVELMYENRFHLEELVTGVSLESGVQLKSDVMENNAKIAEILSKYYDVSLTMESESLSKIRSFNEKYRAYLKVERKIIELALAGDKEAAESLFLNKSYGMYQAVVNPGISYSNEEFKKIDRQYHADETKANNIKIALYFTLGFALIFAVLLFIGAGKAYLDR